MAAAIPKFAPSAQQLLDLQARIELAWRTNATEVFFTADECVVLASALGIAHGQVLLAPEPLDVRVGWVTLIKAGLLARGLPAGVIPQATWDALARVEPDVLETMATLVLRPPSLGGTWPRSDILADMADRNAELEKQLQSKSNALRLASKTIDEGAAELAALKQDVQRQVAEGIRAAVAGRAAVGMPAEHLYSALGQQLANGEAPQVVVACTGYAASWCPNCGDCACPKDPEGERIEESDECPLHGHRSNHAVEAETVEGNPLGHPRCKVCHPKGAAT